MAQSLSQNSAPIAPQKSFLGRIFSLLAVAVLAVTATLTVGLSPANAEEEKTLQEWFPNPELSAIIGGIMAKGPTDEISASEFSVVTSLRITTQNTNVQSFSEFAPLQWLTSLVIQNQSMTDFSGVGGLPRLAHLETTNTPIESLAGLETATNLTTLSLGYGYSPIFSSNINVLAPISSLTSLVNLQIRFGSLTNEHFANVRITPNITNLTLTANLLESLDNLTYLDNLRSLDLRDNKLRSLDNAQLLTRLTSLQVDNTNHGYGNNEAVYGIGTNSIIDFSPVSISNGSYNLTLYLTRQSGRATFTFSPTENLFIYDLDSIKPPVSSTTVPTVTFHNLSQGVNLNSTLNRLELTPEQYAVLDPSQELFQASVRSPLSILGTIWMYPAAPLTYTVEYTDGVDGTEVFPNQTHTDLTHGSTTPAFTGTPTRTGFTFAGWQPSVAATVTENVTYTALWEAIIPIDPTPVDPSPSEPGTPETQHPPVSQPENGSLSRTGATPDSVSLLTAGIMILGVGGALLIARARQRKTDEIVK